MYIFWFERLWCMNEWSWLFLVSVHKRFKEEIDDRFYLDISVVWLSFFADFYIIINTVIMQIKSFIIQCRRDNRSFIQNIILTTSHFNFRISLVVITYFVTDVSIFFYMKYILCRTISKLPLVSCALNIKTH